MKESRLKEARLKAGLRQKDLAEQVGVSLAAIRKYEQDPETLKAAAFETIIKICDILHTNPMKITGLEKIHSQKPSGNDTGGTI